MQRVRRRQHINYIYLSAPLDSADEAGFTRAINLAEKTYGHIDGLILNAGVLEPMGKVTLAGNSLAQWKEHFDINFFSLVTALRAAAPALRASELGGRVVFVSSGSAIGGLSGWAPYNASKAAMNSLCRCQRLRLCLAGLCSCFVSKDICKR